MHGYDPAAITAPITQGAYGGAADPVSQILSGYLDTFKNGRQGLSARQTRRLTTDVIVTLSPQSTVLSMLHGRASLRPNDIAFTFTDYEKDWEGVRESVTWSQLSRRTFNVAREIRQHGSVGDRAVILAPQGLDYIFAFLGAMQAGLIAVPLPLPHRGSTHDRVSAVFEDTSPSVVLTTSSAAHDVGDYVDQSRMETAPKIVEIDRLNLDTDGGPIVEIADLPSTAYLQYSSGSTRTPTG